jgi:hypothetical protein
MGDDIGWFNPSCYNRGMMGFKTPNIDRIAADGAMFMTWLCAAELYRRSRRFHLPDNLPFVLASPGGSAGC